MTLERPMFPPRREVETIEPFAMQDMFVASLVRVDRIGSVRRLVFAVPDGSDPDVPVRVVTARLVLPVEALAEIAAQLLDVPLDAGAGAFAPRGATVN
ncbi:hypothetical protein ABID59_001424 [Bradyrhizobium sp. S3.3.6]|uniref:hypothetical protein n=1 Tax=Bradyrhizobium sp. S3.3.6 TaxID=3156429 RepID=UPI003398F020